MTMSNLNQANRFWPVFKHVTRKVSHLGAMLSPTKRRERTQWLRQDGVAFLRLVGIGPGDTVVDFGCGFGAYSIPAALLVGDNGLVVSVDVRATALRGLKRRATAEGIRNIRTAQHLAELTILLKDRPCKAILLYDILHFMDADARTRLYGVFHETLRSDGFLSVFPMHLRADSPSRYFRDMLIEDVSSEIEKTGFRLCGRLETRLWHNPDRVRGTVLTFRKANGAAAGPVEASAGNGTQSMGIKERPCV